MSTKKKWSTISEIFYPKSREAWRGWLSTYSQSKDVIWLQYYKKASGKYTLPYDDMVEECLCFGWIDGLIKSNDGGSVQRITPRRSKGSFFSELNQQRYYKLIHDNLITEQGRLDVLNKQLRHPSFKCPAIDSWPSWVNDIIDNHELGEEFKDKFHKLPNFYQRLKYFWVCESSLIESSKKRFAFLMKNTLAGKQYGTQPLESYDESAIIKAFDEWQNKSNNDNNNDKKKEKKRKRAPKNTTNKQQPVRSSKRLKTMK